MDSEQRIQELEARVAELSREVRVLRSEPAAGPGSGPAEVSPIALAGARSRRNVLKLAGAAAAGSALAVAARGGTVAAADTDPVRAGQRVSTTSGSSNPTVLEYTNASGPMVSSGGTDVTANIFLARDAPTTNGNPDRATQFPAAVAGYAFSAVPNGLYGYTEQPGYGAIGFGSRSGSVGVLASGVKAALELRPSAGGPPAAGADAHSAGELVMDAEHNLWLCVAAGSPGAWRKLSGPAGAGSFHALAPTRAYDSRVAQPAPGALSNGGTRTLSVSRRRSVATGAEEGPLVPARATAISCNVTVVNTLAGGFLTLNPGGTTTVSGATVNWSASGQILNNGVIVQLNGALEVTAVVGGTAATRTDFVVDVTGYFL